MISRLQPRSFASEFDAIISSADFSTLSSAQLREKTVEALQRCGHGEGSAFDIDEEEPRFIKQPSWATHPDRWMALRLVAEDYFSAEDPASDGEKEEAEEEPVEPSDDEDDTESEEDDGSAAQRAIESVVGKFSKKKEVDDFLLGTLPTLPVIGWPVRVLIAIFEFLRFAWNWFLDFLTKIADRLDVKNNLIHAIEYVAGRSRLTKAIVVVLATTVSYLGFFIFAVIFPVLRVIADPFGRLIRTIRKRLRSEDDDSDDDSGVPG